MTKIFKQRTFGSWVALFTLFFSACAFFDDSVGKFRVPARPADWRVDLFTPTAYHVDKGEILSFNASGGWYIGVMGQSIGPDGVDALCECPVSEPDGANFRGPLGALIGRIGENGTPFLIGSRRTLISAEEGFLYLTANDNMGPCYGQKRGSCYNDNRGSITVLLQSSKQSKSQTTETKRSISP